MLCFVQDDSISWEPFLFSVAASFHTLRPRQTLSNTPDFELHSKRRELELEALPAAEVQLSKGEEQ